MTEPRSCLSRGRSTLMRPTEREAVAQIHPDDGTHRETAIGLDDESAETGGCDSRSCLASESGYGIMGYDFFVFLVKKGGWLYGVEEGGVLVSPDGYEFSFG